MVTKWPDCANRNPLQTSDDDGDDYVDDNNGENEDSAHNDDRVDGDNDVNNSDANDLVQSVEILCGLTVKVKPPDASEQLLNIGVRKKLNHPLHNYMIMINKRENLIKMAKKTRIQIETWLKIVPFGQRKTQLRSPKH